MPYLMGIDIGTTGARAVISDECGNIVGEGTGEYPIYQPQPLWAEQDPLEWWDGVKRAVKTALKESKIAAGEIKGIGLTGQMHSLVLLDKDREILRKSILWCDQRSAPQCEYILRKNRQLLVKTTCNTALAGFTLPKILWVKQNEKEIYSKTDKILLPKDFIRFKLSGEFASDVSDASGTLLFDVRKRRWSEELLDSYSIKKEWLPKIYESHEITGSVNLAASQETGLAEGTPIVAGGGDQAAGGIGTGIVEEGLVSISIGTSGVVFAMLDDVKTDPLLRTHTFCHAVKGKWHIMGVMLQAGGSFKWYKECFCSEEEEFAKKKKKNVYDVITKQAEKIQAGSEGLIFLPYLMGERTPHPDPFAKGVFFGITPRHSKPHFARAVMEGISFGLRDSIEIIKKLGIKINRIVVSGGGARSAVWRQILSDINDTEISTINITESPAFGALLLAGTGTGVYKTIKEACDRAIKITDTVTPVKEAAKKYEEYYKIYHSLYPGLKENFERISRI